MRNYRDRQAGSGLVLGCDQHFDKKHSLKTRASSRPFMALNTCTYAASTYLQRSLSAVISSVAVSVVDLTDDNAVIRGYFDAG